jgi:predicted enzyme related to lactoylglutathione lyase
MAHGFPNSVVHLELRTGNAACACAFYTRLFGWRAQQVRMSFGKYTTLMPGGPIGGGVVEHPAECAYWLPYIEVADIAVMTEEAQLLGASVLLPPREGPAGWRSVLAAPEGAMFALWQPKG